MSPCAHDFGGGTTLFRARDYISGDLFQIIRCERCGLAFTHPMPTDWSKYYPAAYYGAQGGRRFPGIVEQLQDALYSSRVRMVEKSSGGKPGRVLDVGCGRGLLLKQFQKRGWQVEGTELDEKAAAYGREVLGLPIKTGTLTEMAFPNAQFDAVVMWHVLEHVPEVEVILAEITRILKPGGVFLVAVPNFGSIEARMTRSGWFHLDVPRHLNHFTREILLKQLLAAGLSAEGFSYFAPEYDLFSFVQSTLNRIGLRHNLLYNLLRRKSAKVLEQPPLLQSILSVLLAVPLSLLGLVCTTIAGVVGEGATITVVARKRAG